MILKIWRNLVVHLKMITGLKERTFAVQKATIVGKITQIYCNYKDKKNHNLLIILLLTSKFLKFCIALNWGREIPFPPHFCHIYMIKFWLFIYVRRSWVLSRADSTMLGTFVKEIGRVSILKVFKTYWGRQSLQLRTVTKSQYKITQ